MSRAGYADFFPAAPSVLAKKAQQAEREKARQAHDQPKCISGVVPAGFLSINNPKAPPPNSANLVPVNLLNQKLTPRTSGPSPPTLQSPSRTKHDSLSQKAIPRGDPPHSALLTPKATPPAVKPDSALKNWRVKYDPALEKKGAPVKSKHTIVRWDGEGITTPVTDPRAAIPNYLKGPISGKKRLRSQGLYRTRWQWDENYVGPGPPSQILITGLSLLATEHDVQMHFRPCGEVQQVEIKVDPSTGGSLGLCSINYRDHKVNKTPAHEAARKAVQKCNGVAIRMEKITVELDRDGLKCQKLMERILRRKREEERRKEQEALKNRPPPPPPPPPRASQPDRDSGSTRRRESSPRREARSPTRGSKQNCYDTVEDIKKKIGRKPYIFIDKASIPGEERYTPHLFGRLKNFGLHDIIRDTSGFFVVFNDAWNMQRCFRMCDGDRLFSFTMNMHMHLEGVRCTRIPGRSPSPSSKSNTKEMKVESKRTRDIDPVTEATNGLIKEMKAALLKDVKKRIAAPTLYDFLEPSRHIKKQKLDELEPEAVVGLEGHHVDPLSSAQVLAIKANNLPPIATSIPQVNSLGTPTPTAPSFPKLETLSPKPITAKPGALPRFKKRAVIRRQDTPTSELIPKLNIVSKKPVIANARPLAHQLNRYHSDVGSDDESTNTGDRPTSRGDSMSRAMSTDTESIAPSVIDRNLKRKRSSVGPTSRLRDAAMSTDDEEEVRPVASITAQADKKSKPERVKSDLCDEIADLAAFICESGDEEVRNGITTNKKGLKQKKGKKRSRDLDFTSSDESEKDVPLARKKKKPTLDDDEDEDDDMHESIERPTATESESEAFRRKPKNAKARVAGKPVSTLRKSVGVNDAEEENKDISWETSATGGPIATVQDDDNTILDLEGMQHLVKDNEDFEFLRLALEGVKNADMGNIFAWAYKQKELKAANGGANRSPEKIEGFFHPNPSGCARTEGYRRIPEAEKSMYLPHRLLLASKKSAAAQTPSTQPASAPNATSKPSKNAGVTSRSNRVNNRRLVAELNNQKILLSSDADVIRFNQLKKRKKPVKFARSAIHNWGLYAMENIAANDMIIEYVGEIVRQQVADMREKKYLKSGIGSSYLFRIDDVTVIDATKRGGIARFINHSCTPNCTAKIIKVEGSKRIVIYALRDIRENEELTYDYKFERELDSEERIPCLCGSSGCKGFLN